MRALSRMIRWFYKLIRRFYNPPEFAAWRKLYIVATLGFISAYLVLQPGFGWQLGLGVSIWVLLWIHLGRISYRSLLLYRSSRPPVPVGMPSERSSVTKRFRIKQPPLVTAEGHRVNRDLKGYITAGLREDGSVGELFIRASKQGTLDAGLLHALAVTASVGLQSGLRLEKLVEKWEHMGFEPSGLTDDKDIPMCASVVDYLAKWLKRRFISGEESL